MRRKDFEHVIFAAAEVSGEREIVVIGSQAIFGNVDDPLAGMLISMEADVYPRADLPRRRVGLPKHGGMLDGIVGRVARTTGR